jgi:hypothetical protein
LVLKRSITAGRRSSEAYEHLAGVTAAKQVDEGAGSLVKAAHDGLGVGELAVPEPAADVRDHGRHPVAVVIDDDEPLLMSER